MPVKRFNTLKKCIEFILNNISYISVSKKYCSGTNKEFGFLVLASKSKLFGECCSLYPGQFTDSEIKY